MSGNGPLVADPKDAQVLRWPNRVLSADDLRRNLNGQRELVLLPNTVVTPLAADEIRASGIRITRQAEAAAEKPAATGAWGYALEQPQPLVTSVIQTLGREGLHVKLLSAATDKKSCVWARAIADCVARRECLGGVVFCLDTGLVCCVANKVPGLRAAAVVNAGQAARALLTLGANLLAVEMPGRTFFEVRQIVRCLSKPAVCPPGVGCTLQELDGHAHR